MKRHPLPVCNGADPAWEAQYEADRLVDEYPGELEPKAPKRKLMSRAELEAFWAGVRAAREVTK